MTLLLIFGKVDSRLMRHGGLNEFVPEPGRNLAAQDTSGGTPSQRNVVCVWYNILFQRLFLRISLTHLLSFFAGWRPYNSIQT